MANLRSSDPAPERPAPGSLFFRVVLSVSDAQVTQRRIVKVDGVEQPIEQSADAKRVRVAFEPYVVDDDGTIQQSTRHKIVEHVIDVTKAELEMASRASPMGDELAVLTNEATAVVARGMLDAGILTLENER